MESCLTEQVLIYYRENRWRDILALNKNSDNDAARKLLWVWPSEENLTFIRNIVKKFRLKGLISIGCGCGLLEWIIQQSTDLSVVGFEVNEEWWQSRYSNPKFIDLIFPDLPPAENLLNPQFALLFCYFNDGNAFREYLNCYTGNLVIIIGPGDGAGRHTDPAPFQPEFPPNGPQWRLYQYQEIKNSKDFIAAYVKNAQCN